MTKNLCMKIVVWKYIYPLSCIDWVRIQNKYKSNVSNIWKVLLASFNIIESRISWRIGTGEQALIGIDPWSGNGGSYVIPPKLIKYLNRQGIEIINHISNPEATSIWGQGWKITHDLNIP